MRHENRRKELGKMLIDVGKYFLTAGILGGFFADKLTAAMGAGVLIIAVISAIAGFYIIPARKE